MSEDLGSAPVNNDVRETFQHTLRELEAAVAAAQARVVELTANRDRSEGVFRRFERGFSSGAFSEVDIITGLLKFSPYPGNVRILAINACFECDLRTFQIRFSALQCRFIREI